jgi:hypothetical protein
VTYTLIAGIDLLEAVRRYGLAGRVGTVPDVAALPLRLHDRTEPPEPSGDSGTVGQRQEEQLVLTG